MILSTPTPSQALQKAVIWTLGLVLYGVVNAFVRVAYHWPWQCFVVYAAHMLTFQSLTSPGPLADLVLGVCVITTAFLYIRSMIHTWQRTLFGIYILLTPFHGIEGDLQILSVCLLFCLLDGRLWFDDAMAGITG